MIFTHKNDVSAEKFIFPEKPKLDIFCLFAVDHGVFVPENDWFMSVKASLRRGHEVLILEKSNLKIPELNFSSRWEIHDNWMWIASRAYRAFSESYDKNGPTLVSVKSYLKNSK